MLITKYIEKLTWDTEFFCIPIGRITTSVLDGDAAIAVLEEARREGLRCLYFEADPNDLTTQLTVEKYGFHLVDVRVVLEYPFENRPAPSLKYPIPPELVINTARESDLPRLEEIAMEVGQFSRYTFDNNFKAGEDKRLYRLWIANSLHGRADVVFVARWREERGEAMGLISCKEERGLSHIELAGVHHEYRQKGVGTGLVQAALDWSRSRATKKMHVATQARNVPAQRLYQQMGFFTKSMTLYFHKWLEWPNA
jgi:ribosomal protein S18 acetylase RimI-like enzyme